MMERKILEKSLYARILKSFIGNKKEERTLKIVCLDLDQNLSPQVKKILGSFQTYEDAEPRYSYYMYMAVDHSTLLTLKVELVSQKNIGADDARLEHLPNSAYIIGD